MMRNSLKFIDIAVNLTDPMFRGIYHGKQCHNDDLNNVLQRSLDCGVEKIIVTGTTLSESKAALDLASQNDQLYCTVGCHPTNSDEFNQYESGSEKYYSELLELAKIGKSKGKVVAIGEIGLDYDRTKFCSKQVQKEYFEMQLNLASETQLPVFFHDRNTNMDFLNTIKRNRDKFSTGVVHSFTGTLEEAEAYIELGLYIGINGCSLKTKENVEVVTALPLDKLVIETDAPWCDVRPTHASYGYLNGTPILGYEKKKKEKFEMGSMVKGRNEPCEVGNIGYILYSLKGKGVSFEEFASVLYQNASQVYFEKQ